MNKDINVYRILYDYLFVHKDDIITNFSLFKKSKYFLFLSDDGIYIVLKSKSNFLSGNIISSTEKVLKVSKDNNIKLYFHLSSIYSFHYSVYSIVIDSNIVCLIYDLFKEHYVKLIKKRKVFNNLYKIDKELIEFESLYGMNSNIQFPIYCILEFNLGKNINIIRIDSKDCIFLQESKRLIIKNCYIYRVEDCNNIYINCNNYYTKYDNVHNFRYSILYNYVFADIIKYQYKIYKANSKLSKYLEMNYRRLLVNKDNHIH